MVMSEEKVIYKYKDIYEQLEHTGDVYIKAYGRDLVSLLENSGIALFDTMVNIDRVECRVEKTINVEGFDLENLLYRWLEELLLLYYSENLVCSKVVVEELKISRVNGELAYYLKGLACCEKFNSEKHEPRVEVKSPTYSLMRIVKTEGAWVAYFVLDI
jgi:SHS2 domain-containing protein